MMNPEMMRMAQEMAAKMTPEQRQNMQNMAANMDPEMIRRMQASMMGGGAAQGPVGRSMSAPVQSSAPAMPPEVAAANARKVKGNDSHKGGKYDEAIDHYTAAADAVAGELSGIRDLGGTSDHPFY